MLQHLCSLLSSWNRAAVTLLPRFATVSGFENTILAFLNILAVSYIHSLASMHTVMKAKASKQFLFTLGVEGIRNTLGSSMFWLFVLNRWTDLRTEARAKCERCI